MALDAQRNWNVEMSQPANTHPHSLNANAANNLSSPFGSLAISSHLIDSPRAIVLPSEILTNIINSLPHQATSQSTLLSCTLVSRAWYSASIARLYECPYLEGGNFQAFVQTVCPSKNAHIRPSSLSIFVKNLNMSNLVHNSTRSLTARLVGRLKGNLEEFVAPQSSFGLNSFAALSKCKNLTFLDLSLISASISNSGLFRTLQSLQELETLFFPRTRTHDLDSTTYSWPPKLKALHLAGGIDDRFLQSQLILVPKCMKTLSIQHCSQIRTPTAIYDALIVFGSQLTHLTIREPLPHLSQGSLNEVLLHCKSLIALRISADFITDSMMGYVACHTSHPLRILDIEASPSYIPSELHSTPFYWAVEHGQTPDLRSIRISPRLGWGISPEAKQELKDLEEAMKDHEDENPLGIATGIWQIGA